MTTLIPTDPQTRLRRKEAAEALTAAGYRTAAPTLASLATRGGGPRYRLFGGVVDYAWADLLAWAEGRAVYRGGPVAEHQHQDAA